MKTINKITQRQLEILKQVSTLPITGETGDLIQLTNGSLHTWVNDSWQEVGGGGGGEILVDILDQPSTSLIETIVGTYNISSMVAQDGIIDIDLRHGKNTSGTQEIFIYLSDNPLAFGTKVRRSALLQNNNSSVGFRTMFYVKNNEISVNRAVTLSSGDDGVLGSNAIRTTILNNASNLKYLHIVLNSGVPNNTIYGFIKNVK